jgi:hypothetical protein
MWWSRPSPASRRPSARGGLDRSMGWTMCEVRAGTVRFVANDARMSRKYQFNHSVARGVPDTPRHVNGVAANADY